MQCKKCGGEMKPSDFRIRGVTAVKHREVHQCLRCLLVAFVFAVSDEEDLILWLDEKPRALPFAEFLQKKILERRQAQAS